jgi:hypothetical protein
MSKSNIKAYDLHGTIDERPEDYKTLFKEIREEGNKVWIISGPPTPQVIEELKNLGLEHGIHYDEAIGVVSHLLHKKHTPTKIAEDGSYFFEEEAWWSSKADICRDYNISSLVDNEIKYASYFLNHPTSFILSISQDRGEPLYFELLTPFE